MAKFNVCKPTARNRETNNYCVSVEQCSNGKDFLFKFDNNREVLVPSNKINEYHQSHPESWCQGFPIYDEDGTFKRYIANVTYILIPKDFVLSFAK